MAGRTEDLTPQELYKRAMRLRLTRAGLLKIMRENEEREKSKVDKEPLVS